MPCFHFHTEDGHIERDEDGTDLASLASARLEASRLVGEILRDRPEELWVENSWQMTVTDDQDLTLFTIHVAATLAPGAGRE